MAQLEIMHPHKHETVHSLIEFAAFGSTRDPSPSIFGELLDGRGELVAKSSETFVQGNLWFLWFRIKDRVHPKSAYSVRITDPDAHAEASVGPIHFDEPKDTFQDHGVKITYPGEGEHVCPGFWAYGGFDAGFMPTTMSGEMIPKMGSPTPGQMVSITTSGWKMWFQMGTAAVGKTGYKLEVTSDLGGEAHRGHIKVKGCGTDGPEAGACGWLSALFGRIFGRKERVAS